MQTEAIIFTRKEEATIGKLDVPPPGEGEIQVRSHYTTISVGTEGWIFRNLFTWSPTPFPCVPGYQRAGVVTTVGPKTEGWNVGDRAMAVIGTWAGKEVESFWGGHIAIANVPASFAFRLADGVHDIDASGAVVAQVGYNAAHRATYKAGDWIVAYGDGIICQSASQAARARGARVVLVGHRKERLELGKQFSADAVVNSKTEDVVKAVRKIVGAETFDRGLLMRGEKVVHGELVVIEEAICLLCSSRQVGGLGLTPGAAGLGDGGLRLTEEIGEHSAQPRDETLVAEIGASELVRDPIGDGQ